jgi:hypothetical protein
MVRTLLLVFAFSFFTNEAAKFGVVALAATHIVLQIMAFTAFFLDGFAYVAESLSGRSYGAKDKATFTMVLRRTTMAGRYCRHWIVCSGTVIGRSPHSHTHKPRRGRCPVNDTATGLCSLCTGLVSCVSVGWSFYWDIANTRNAQRIAGLDGDISVCNRVVG